MFKFKQGKKLIISLISLMLAVLAVFLCCYFVPKYTNRNENGLPQSGTVADYDEMDGDSVCDFATGRITSIEDDRYKNYKFFSISNYEELLNFSVSVAYGCTFQGKIVYLEENIDSCAPGPRQYANWQPIGASMNTYAYHGAKAFEGTFDGNYKTIKNLSCRIDSFSAASLESIKMGLFSYTHNAIIKNVRLQNMSLKNYNSDFCGFYMSAFVGIAEGFVQFEECLVDNIVLNLQDGAKDVYFGGFIGYFNTTVASGSCSITNSMISNLTVNGSDYKEIKTICSKSNVNWFLGVSTNYSFKTIIIKNCNDFGNVKEYDSELFKIGDNIVYKDRDECILELKEKEDMWYIPPTNEFNGGWPYLKAFIEFNYWTFTPGENGKINDSTDSVVIEIPNTIDISSLVSINHHLFYGTEILAEGNDGYKFKDWTNSEDGKTFTANFELKPFKIYIDPTSITYNGRTYTVQPIEIYGTGDRYLIGEVDLDDEIVLNYYAQRDGSWQIGVFIEKSDGSNIVSGFSHSANKDTWKVHYLKSFIINTAELIDELDLESLEPLYVSDIAELVGCTLAELAHNGIRIIVTFDEKSYGVGVS